MSSAFLSHRAGSVLRRSVENIEIVPQEAVIQHKGPETMAQEKVLLTTATDMPIVKAPEIAHPPSTSGCSSTNKNRPQVMVHKV